MKPRKGQKIWRFLQRNPKAWCKGTAIHNARMKNGKPCDHDHPKACRWCVYGLLNIFYPGENMDEVDDILILKSNIWNPASWNDAPERTVKDVIAAFKKAGL